MSVILSCGAFPWNPGFDGVGLAGWSIAILYALAAVACGRLVWVINTPHRRAERVFWLLCTALLLLLAIGRPLDLQTLLTSLGRCAAQAQGWYDHRRVVQLGFILFAGAAGLAVAATGLVFLRRTYARTGLAIVGLGFICTFIVIRATSLHAVDTLLNQSLVGLPLAMALEIPGPLLILIVALRARSAGRS